MVKLSPEERKKQEEELQKALRDLVEAFEADKSSVARTSDASSSILKERNYQAEQEVKERETEREGWEKYYELRNKWSRYLFWFMFIMILFQIFLTAAIGLKLLDFKDYGKFLYLVIGENFLQIAGMVVVVVKFLFSHSDHIKK